MTDEGNRSETFRPFRKVFAMVPTNNFSKFRRRCNDEGISLDKALSSLVIIYSNGGEVVIPESKKKVVLRECQYLKQKNIVEEETNEKGDS